MQEAIALAALVGALGLGVISPGPSFVLVARVAAGQGRAQGLAAALGMGVGGAVFAVAALLGLHGVLTAVPTLFVVLKVAGGLYLCWLGVRIVRGASAPLDLAAPDDARHVANAAAAGERTRASQRAFALGLGTQLSNPKTALVYASVFAALLPPQHTLWFSVALAIVVFALEAGWYTVVAWMLSAAAPRAAYLGAKRWIDRLCGGVMILLGLRLIASARP